MSLGSIYIKPAGVVALAKEMCHIQGDNKHLTDEQIGRICRYIAEEFAEDTTYEDGKSKFGEMGISIMLSVSLYEFPWHYQKWQLWQRN
jgi:hypothetical protein